MKALKSVAIVFVLCLAAVLLMWGVSDTPAEGQSVGGSFTVENTPTPTPSPTPTITPTPTPTPLKLALDILGSDSAWNISANGVLLEDIEASSDNGMVTLSIPQGTIVLCYDFEVIVVSVAPPAPPPHGYEIIHTLDFQINCIFDPSATVDIVYDQDSLPQEVTINYDPQNLPQGTDEVNLTVAYFNEAAKEWIRLPGEVDPDANTVTFSMGHFTIFAILMAVAPNITPTPLPAPFPGVGGWFGIGFGIFLLLALLFIWFVLKWRRKWRRIPRRLASRRRR